MEFTFTYNRPQRAINRREALKAELSQIDQQIEELQGQRREAMDELAATETMLLQNGHTTINIAQPTLAAPTQTEQLPAPAANAEINDDSLPVYDIKWSLRDKLKYIYLKDGNDPEWTTDEMKVRLLEIEPKNDKIKNLSTIVGQNIDKVFVRKNKNGSKPTYKLMKGVTLEP